MSYITLAHIESIDISKGNEVYSYLECKYVYRPAKGWGWFRFPSKAGFYELNLWYSNSDEYIGDDFDDLKIGGRFRFDESIMAIRWKPSTQITMVSGKTFRKYYDDYYVALCYTESVRQMISDHKAGKIHNGFITT